jgi:acetyl-CoA carboxylase carboxyl transferase subunit beta
MHEGILSLMQMAKTSAAVALLAEAGLPYVTVLVDPCTAGVHASFASLGDVIIAEPGALIGFAGERVAQQAGVINRPPNFQRAEFQLDNGMVDMVVPRKDLKQNLVKILQFCCPEVVDAA